MSSESGSKPTTKPLKPTKKQSTISKEKTGGEKGGNDKCHRLSLKGSAKLVTEFFEYSIHSILFQRGVYPAEDFTPVKKYGLNMLVSFDQDVKAYIKSIMRQLSRWMLKGKVKTLVLVISSKDSGEHLERWQFDVQLLSTSATAGAGSAVEAGESVHVEAPAPGVPEKEKTEKEIQMEIQALFRNIHASVAILPMLDGRCTFTVLVYADGDVEVPMEWGDSDAKEIADGEKMAFRSWGTSSHRIDSLVSYRLAH